MEIAHCPTGWEVPSTGIEVEIRDTLEIDLSILKDRIAIFDSTFEAEEIPHSSEGYFRNCGNESALNIAVRNIPSNGWKCNEIHHQSEGLKLTGVLFSPKLIV